MLTVNFKEKLGFVKANDGTEYPFFSCNGLLAVCPKYTNDEGVECRYLHCFFSDERHMNNMLGLTKEFKVDCFGPMFDSGIDRIVLKKKWGDRATVCRSLLKAGYCVQIVDF